jgi:hypothetical protein
MFHGDLMAGYFGAVVAQANSRFLDPAVASARAALGMTKLLENEKVMR